MQPVSDDLIRMTTAARAAVPAVLLFSLLFTGCGSRQAKLPVLRVDERDFTISAPRSVRAGAFRLDIHNDGPVAHELLIARAEPGRLPLRDDGFTIKEEAIEPRLVTVAEPQPPGHDEAKVLKLARGRYVLFCNMAGHYAAGMQRVLDVR